MHFFVDNFSSSNSYWRNVFELIIKYRDNTRIQRATNITSSSVFAVNNIGTLNKLNNVRFVNGTPCESIMI
jgi:hypothetical protein